MAVDSRGGILGWMSFSVSDRGTGVEALSYDVNSRNSPCSDGAC